MKFVFAAVACCWALDSDETMMLQTKSGAQTSPPVTPAPPPITVFPCPAVLPPACWSPNKLVSKGVHLINGCEVEEWYCHHCPVYSFPICQPCGEPQRVKDTITDEYGCVSFTWHDCDCPELPTIEVATVSQIQEHTHTSPVVCVQESTVCAPHETLHCRETVTDPDTGCQYEECVCHQCPMMSWPICEPCGQPKTVKDTITDEFGCTSYTWNDCDCQELVVTVGVIEQQQQCPVMSWPMCQPCNQPRRVKSVTTNDNGCEVYTWHECDCPPLPVITVGVTQSHQCPMMSWPMCQPCNKPRRVKTVTTDANGCESYTWHDCDCPALPIMTAKHYP